MSSSSSAPALLEAVAKYLREEVLAEVRGSTAFNVRVSASALDLVARELVLRLDNENGEHARLRALLGNDGTLDDLRELLCDRIASGELTEESAPLRRHLWATVTAQLAVDQPSYSAYIRAVSLAAQSP